MFDLDNRALVWADLAPRLYAHAAAAQWDPAIAIDWSALAAEGGDPPNRRPTAAVPTRWDANSTMMITAVIGTTRLSSDGSTTFSPSTADSTEIPA